MNRLNHHRAAALLGAAIVFAGPAHAQCNPEWLPTPSIPGLTGDGTVTCATTWDPDGAGPAESMLVVGGQFDAAGNVLTGGLAAWDGQEWSSLNGPAAQVLAVYNGDLIAGGFFFTAGGVPAQRIARYDGTAWHPLGAGLNQTVRALAVYNGELIAGGFFTDAGGGTADYIARWNGTSWSPLGSGVNDVVTALTVHNGELFVGGGFSTAGGQPADNVARWNGSAWQGFNDPHDVINVHALHVFQGELIASGTFIPAGTGSSDFVVRWTGTAWQELGGGTSDHIFDFCEYNGDLICGGLFHSAGGVSALHLAAWNGSFWSPVFDMPAVGALTEYRGDLIIGGLGFKPNQTFMTLVLRWNGQFPPGNVGRGTDGLINDFESYNGDLYAGGEFTQIGGVDAPGVARRVQGEWQAVGAGAGGVVRDLAVFNGALIASGTFGTSSWDGQTWHPHGVTPVDGMTVYNAGLYAAIGFTGPNGVGRWNPSTFSWDTIGTFPETVFVGTLMVHNGDLIAGGSGGFAGVWRLNEDEWVPIGGSLGGGTVQTLAVYNGEFIAGGFFLGTSGNLLHRVARFNGTSWVSLGGGVVEALGNWTDAVYDVIEHDGDLIVAGSFTHVGAGLPSGGIEANNVARWDGAKWSLLGAGTSDPAVCLHRHDGELNFGGYFHRAGGKPAGHWARWGCEAPGCYPDCNADGALTVADFGCFQTRFVANDPYADCNADGGLTVQDFGCFQTQFVGGCR